MEKCRARNLLTSGAKANGDRKLEIPLHLAIAEGQYKRPINEIILSERAHVYVMDGRLGSVLHSACCGLVCSVS